jgi:hypothetical protein
MTPNVYPIGVVKREAQRGALVGNGNCDEPGIDECNWVKKVPVAAFKLKLAGCIL